MTRLIDAIGDPRTTPLGGAVGAIRSAVARKKLPRAALQDSAKGAAGFNQWFYAGDLLQWLSHHNQLSGVQRVTFELLKELRGGGSVWPLGVCALDGAKLASLDVPHLSSLLPKATAVEELKSLPGIVSRPGQQVQAGDHVLFTGFVWTPFYADLFESLSSVGIRYSVLVHDIIPLTHPQFVDEQYRRDFARWVRTIATSAETIFVSGQRNRADLVIAHLGRPSDEV